MLVTIKSPMMATPKKMYITFKLYYSEDRKVQSNLKSIIALSKRLSPNILRYLPTVESCAKNPIQYCFRSEVVAFDLVWIRPRLFSLFIGFLHKEIEVVIDYVDFCGFYWWLFSVSLLFTGFVTRFHSPENP